MGDGEHTARVFITCPCGKRGKDGLLDEFPRLVGTTSVSGSMCRVSCSGDGSGNASRASLSKISQACQQTCLGL